MCLYTSFSLWYNFTSYWLILLQKPLTMKHIMVVAGNCDPPVKDCSNLVRWSWCLWRYYIMPGADHKLTLMYISSNVHKNRMLLYTTWYISTSSRSNLDVVCVIIKRMLWWLGYMHLDQWSILEIYVCLTCTIQYRPDTFKREQKFQAASQEITKGQLTVLLPILRYANLDLPLP